MRLPSIRADLRSIQVNAPPFSEIQLNSGHLHMVKRYPEPMAHGPEACEPSHPCGSRSHRMSAGHPCSLTREIWNPISNH